MLQGCPAPAVLSPAPASEREQCQTVALNVAAAASGQGISLLQLHMLLEHQFDRSLSSTFEALPAVWEKAG